LVLTAEHCTRDVHGKHPVRGLRVIRASDGASADVVKTVASSGDLDVAVLQLADTAPWDSKLPQPIYARVKRDYSGRLHDCEVVGYPLMQRNPDKKTRGTAELHLTIYKTDEAESGRLLMREQLIGSGSILAPAHDGDARTQAKQDSPSPWDGLSGALVFHRGRALGVVVEHHLRQGDSALQAIAFDTIAKKATTDPSARSVAEALALPPVLPVATEQPLQPPELVEPDESALRAPRASVVGALVVGEIPQEPTAFQRRAELLTQLSAAPGVAVVMAVTGSRGIGKTQLAAAFARQCIAAHWPVVAWIVAENAAQTMAGMDRLARELRLAAQSDDSATAARKARHWLETQADASTLVVFDNVHDPAVVRPWLPAVGQARIVLTSTNQACEDLGSPVAVDVFTLAEAVAFLRDRTGLADDVGAEALAEEVGCLPLALGQAAAVVRTQRLSYDTVVGRLQSMPLHRLLTHNSGDPYPHGAAEAVLLGLQPIEGTDSLAHPLASLIAMLSPAGTRRDLLHTYATLDEHRGGIMLPDIDSTIGRLAEASLLTFSYYGDTIIMHRFTQRVIRDREQRAGTLQNWVLITARMITAVLPVREKRRKQRALCHHLITQIDELWSLIAPDTTGAAISDTTREILRLRRWSNHCLWSIDDSINVTVRAPEVIADHERLLGDDCEDTMQAQYGLALAYGDLGRHNEAIQLNQRITEWYTAKYGADHPSTLNLKNTLANNYLESGQDFAEPSRLETAIALHRQNLEKYERASAAGDPDTLRSARNLIAAYNEAGRTADAIVLGERVLALVEQELDPSDPCTRGAKVSLAMAYAGAGRTSDALSLIEETVVENPLSSDSDNEDIWFNRLNRAKILLKAGQTEPAISELRELASNFTRLLGENSATVRRVLEELARAYRKADHIPEAIRTYEKVLSICSYTLGRDNPITVRLTDELAELRHKRPSKSPRSHIRRLFRRTSLVNQ
jgi:tetratricopeptide (TPR) repeat protein